MEVDLSSLEKLKFQRSSVEIPKKCFVKVILNNDNQQDESLLQYSDNKESCSKPQRN